MEQELEIIKEKVLEFCQRYKCSLELNTEFARKAVCNEIVPMFVSAKIIK